MVNEISRRGILGGAAAAGAMGLGSLADPQHPQRPAMANAQGNRASRPMTPYIGSPTSRVDGRAKVTGAAKYAAEYNRPGLAFGPGLAHGFVVTSSIPKGRIARIDTGAALRVPGVLDVLTHENRPPMSSSDSAYKDDVAPEGSPFRPLYDGRIRFSGQPIALVAADDWETARFAASLIRVDYDEEPHVTDLYRQRDNAVALGEPTDPAEAPFFPPKPRGSADAAFAAAPVRHAGEYYVPIEHHNPMEPYASTAFFEPGGKLQIFDKTQGVQNVQRYVSSALEMKPDDVRVMSPYMGGGFGSGLRPQFQVLLAAMAARKLQRSVRVVLTRQQMYSLGYRPAMIQRIALGANAGGTLDAIRHEAVTVTLQYESFHRQETGWSGLLYKCPNAKYTHKLARLDLATSCDMRAPSAATGVYALECAMDELAVALKLDPLRASPAVLYRSRPEHRPALQQQGPARVLSPGCGGVRLGQAQPRAALDARRQRADGLGHGHRRLGSVAGADCGAHRALCQWPCGGFLRDVRHRHRHLHDHDAGRRRHAWPAARSSHRQAGRRRRCRSRRSKADRGLRPPCRMGSRRHATRSARTCCSSQSGCRIRRLLMPLLTRSRLRTASL